MKYRILYFGTDYCGYCRTTEPTVRKACMEREVEFVKIDPTQDSANIVDLWDLHQMPTTIAVEVKPTGDNGRVLGRWEGGLTPSAVEELFLHIERTFCKEKEDAE